MRVLSVDDLGLRSQGRQPVHGATSSRRSGSPRRAAPAALSHLGTRSDPMNDPTRALQAHAAADVLSSQPFPPNSRYHGVDDAQTTRRRTAERSSSICAAASCRSPERFASLQEHTVTAGRRLDTIAATLPRRSGAVLAHLRRQRRDAPGGADRNARPPAAHHAAGGHPGSRRMLKGIDSAADRPGGADAGARAACSTR